MELQPGFSGMAGRERRRYQAKILWPNLAVLEEAPATAKVGELKKVRAAACMVVGFSGMTWERKEDIGRGVGEKKMGEFYVDCMARWDSCKWAQFGYLIDAGAMSALMSHQYLKSLPCLPRSVINC